MIEEITARPESEAGVGDGFVEAYHLRCACFELHAFKESVHGGVVGKGLREDHIAAGALLLQPCGEIDGHAKIVQPSV